MRYLFLVLFSCMLFAPSPVLALNPDQPVPEIKSNKTLPAAPAHTPATVSANAKPYGFLDDYQNDRFNETLPSAPAGFGFVSLLTKLIFVLGLIYGTVVLIRWFMQQRARLPLPGSTLIKVLDSHYLTPKQALHIVEIAGDIFVVGATDNGLSLLTEIDDAELQAKAKAARPAAPDFAFNKYLKDILKRETTDTRFSNTTVAEAESKLAAEQPSPEPPKAAGEARTD